MHRHAAQEVIPAQGERASVGSGPKATVTRTPAVNTYRREQMLNLSPVEVIQKLYDTAIIGCKKNDQLLAQRALNELVTALDFKHQELSLGLYGLYDYCKRNIRQGNTAEAVGVLEELRSTWMKAFHL